MAESCLAEIGHVLKIDPEPNPELSFDEFAAGVDHLTGAGIPLGRSAEEAWPDFRKLREAYGQFVHPIGSRLVMPPAPWWTSGPERRNG
jgi:hypothetical protein